MNSPGFNKALTKSDMMQSAFKRDRTLATEEVRRTLHALPENVRQAAELLPVMFESVPSPALVADGVEPDTLGLFVGGDHNEEDLDPIPSHIILYLQNIRLMIEEESGNDNEFRKEVRKTYLHELGHYLGLDEDDLADRDLD